MNKNLKTFACETAATTALAAGVSAITYRALPEFFAVATVIAATAAASKTLADGFNAACKNAFGDYTFENGRIICNEPLSKGPVADITLD